MNYRFNLQPWREQARKKKQKNFIATTAIIVFVTLGLIALNYYIETSYIKDQESAVSNLQTEVRKLQNAKDKVETTKDLIAEISKQIQAIEKLQDNRATALELLDYMSVNLPKSVFLNHITFTGSELLVNGIAENDRGVADFMRMLESGSLLSETVLRGIQTAESTERYEVASDSETKEFTVKAVLSNSMGESSETR